MPAIYPARLKQQTARVAESFDEPALLVRRLISLLETYADYTHRPGLVSPTPTLLKTFHTPLPVLRQALAAFKDKARQKPGSALAVCDAFWSEDIFECRWLAVHLLSQLPLELAQASVQRLHTWITEMPDESLWRALEDADFSQLRRTASAALTGYAREWLQKRDQQEIKRGMQLIKFLLTGDEFQDLPSIFRLIAPFLRQAPAPLRPDILDILTMLARQSPHETMQSLLQALNSIDNPDTPWLIRQILSEFPPESQRTLRLALKSS